MTLHFSSNRSLKMVYRTGDAHLLERDIEVIASAQKPSTHMWKRCLKSILGMKKNRTIMNSKLESVWLDYPSSWNFTSNEDFKKLLQTIACLPKLSRLIVRDTPREVNNLAFLLSHAVGSKNLTYLWISYRECEALTSSESDFSALCTSLCNLPYLEQVTIMEGPIDISPLLRGLSLHPSLKKLSLLFYYQAPHVPIDPSALGRVAHFPSLLELDISDNKLQKEHFIALANELRDRSSNRTCSLKILRLHLGVIVDNDVTTALSNSLRVNQSLQRLELSELYYGAPLSSSPVCLRSLAASLQTNSTLKTLRVSLYPCRYVTTDTVFSFQDLLCRSNYTLETVFLHPLPHEFRAPFDYYAKLKFDYYAKLNQYVRSSLKSAGANLSRADWVDALGRCKHNGKRSCIYHGLRRNCCKENRNELEKESLSFVFSILSASPWLCQTKKKTESNRRGWRTTTCKHFPFRIV